MVFRAQSPPQDSSLAEVWAMGKLKRTVQQLSPEGLYPSPIGPQDTCLAQPGLEQVT